MPLATIFGASSNHGRTIVDSLVADQWDVRAVVTSRNAEFQSPNVSVVHMPLAHDAALRQAILGADTVYVSHITDFDDPEYFKQELNEGRMIGDACKDLCTPHVIYNTQLSPKQVLGLSARHCDVKAQIEDYLNHQLRLPLTCLELPFLYENLYTVYQPEMTGRGVYRLAIPMGTQSMDCISYRDVGPVVATLARNRNMSLHKTFALAGDKISIKEISEVFSELTGWQVRDRQISVYEFKDLGWPGCSDIGNYFDFIRRVDQRFNVFVTKELHPGVLSFRQWVDAYKTEVMKNVFGYQINGC